MRKLVLFLFCFVITDAFGQNEFAAAAFYTDFKKVYADAQVGFIEYKGTMKVHEPGTGTVEFGVKLLLPLADSGKIVVPVSGDPYAEYYFQSSRKKEQTDQRAVNLREALLTILGQPLYTRTETLMIGKSVFSTTYFFMDPAITKPELATFSSLVHQENGRYHLSFRLMGKKALIRS